MKYYIEVLKKYVVFSGRSARKEYWYFVLFNIIFVSVLSVIDVFIGSFGENIGILSGLYALAVFIPTIGVTMRRLHDVGHSGWWILIILIPLFGGIIILVFMLLDSQPGENKYGQNPKVVAGNTGVGGSVV